VTRHTLYQAPRPSDETPSAARTGTGASASPSTDEPPFWRTKTLEEMSEAEWESLCDGCGRCCLVKLEDADTGDILFTDVGCSLFDEGSCRCGDYEHRQQRVEDCVRLTPAAVRALSWLPVTCGYRLVAEGRDLEPWHPLRSGRRESVHEAGISVRDRLSGLESDMSVAEQIERVVEWPNRWPTRREQLLNRSRKL